MTTPARLAPLLAQYDDATTRLLTRLRGPEHDSGDGTPVAVDALTDAERLWEPVPGAWSVRRHADGPGTGATVLVGAGEWGRDGGRPHPYPPPVTTIGWRLHHVTELLLGRADWTAGARRLTEEEIVVPTDAATAVADLAGAVGAWREALTSVDDAALDEVGRSTYPYGSDGEVPFLEVVWWVNQEVLHHGAEIALLRDLYRAADGGALTGGGGSA
ncbi:DinB family protein [Cellulomonas shaoxiangyii]|uniref:DinB family protein n=1 Tax=Cellulomonas shaoxiangyii TaxID=2566013 RepID=A0A4P7SJV8_9CELL|nr:DinB family protein [Cellulomonas shaoxiangyii]QCB93998.1 DinB family protein [Cellulomonas shaoxiangyii]TGY83018.1 DinB family protein [Cellulomonas shaoxiangyii]